MHCHFVICRLEWTPYCQTFHLYFYLFKSGECGFGARGRHLPRFRTLHSESVISIEDTLPKGGENISYLVMATSKLRNCFLSCPIIVRSDYPIRQVLFKSDLEGRMMKWVVELSEFEISYKPRKTLRHTSHKWKVFVDGSSNIKWKQCVRLLLKNDQYPILYIVVSFELTTSSNKLKYEPFIVGLRITF